VTIDNSDWIVDQRLKVRLQKDPNADNKALTAILSRAHVDRAQYYDALGKRVLGRPSNTRS